MSLYHYVASKDELLDAMIDIVFEEIELPARRDRLAVGDATARRYPPDRFSHATRGRSVLMESRTSPGPANLRHREAVTACLRRAGFSVLTATHANWLLDSLCLRLRPRQPACSPFDTAESSRT